MKRLLWVAVLVVTVVNVAGFSIRAAHADSPGVSCLSAENSADKAANGGGTASIPCMNNVGVYGVEMRALAAEMAAHPNPGLTPIPIDERKLYEHSFRKVLKETDVFDGPGSTNVVGHIDNGFTFVNAGDEKNGYIQIRPNQWLPKDTLGPPNKAVSKFSGVMMPDGMPDRAFGWMVLDTKPSKVPGARPVPGTPEIKHYTLLNFFATENVDGWEWFMVDPDQWVIQTRVAVLQPVKRPEGITGKWFAVDLYEQTLIAYDNDKAVFATLIATGLPKFPTTEGLFKIWDRHSVVKMSGAGGQPDFYYLPQVPWVMYFNQDQQALHGAYWHDAFGYRHSHGCVNMSMTDAEWAFNWTKDSPEAYVYVYHSGEYKSGAPR